MQDDQKLYRWGGVAMLHPERGPPLVGPGLARWLDDSPFGVPGIDCRPRSYGGFSVTTDPAVPQRFAALCEADGAAYEGQLPEGAVETPCHLVYPELSADPRGIVFVPVVFEDRWVVYQRSAALYFVDSWSGELALVATTAPGLTLTSVWAAPCAGGGTHRVREVDFLVKSHVLDRWCPHPVPPELGTDAEAIAHDAFLTWGRRGTFATTADTTAIDIALEAWPDQSSSTSDGA